METRDMIVISSGDQLPAALQSRLASLYRSFSRDYHAVPVIVARAPGRVNLIGEHIDYSKRQEVQFVTHSRTNGFSGIQRIADGN